MKAIALVFGIFVAALIIAGCCSDETYYEHGSGIIAMIMPGEEEKTFKECLEATFQSARNNPEDKFELRPFEPREIDNIRKLTYSWMQEGRTFPCKLTVVYRTESVTKPVEEIWIAETGRDERFVGPTEKKDFMDGHYWIKVDKNGSNGRLGILQEKKKPYGYEYEIDLTGDMASKRFKKVLLPKEDKKLKIRVVMANDDTVEREIRMSWKDPNDPEKKIEVKGSYAIAEPALDQIKVYRMPQTDKFNYGTAYHRLTKDEGQWEDYPKTRKLGPTENIDYPQLAMFRDVSFMNVFLCYRTYDPQGFKKIYVPKEPDLPESKTKPIVLVQWPVHNDVNKNIVAQFTVIQVGEIWKCKEDQVSFTPPSDSVVREYKVIIKYTKDGKEKVKEKVRPI